MVNLIKKFGVPIIMVSALSLPVSSFAENFRTLDTNKTGTDNSISVFYHKNPETTTPSFMKLDFSRKVGGLWRFGLESEYLDRNRNASVPLILDSVDKIEMKVSAYSSPCFDIGEIEFTNGIGVDFGNIYYKLNKSDIDMFYRLGLEFPVKSGYKFYFSAKDSFFEHKRPSFGIGLKVRF